MTLSLRSMSFRSLRNLSVSIFALTLFLHSSDALAGYYVEHEMVIPNPVAMQPQGAGQPKTLITKIHSWHDGNKLRKETEAQHETIIINLENGMVYGMNSEKKTYWEATTVRYRTISLMPLMVFGVKIQDDGSVLVPGNLFVPTGQVATVNGRKSFELRLNAALPTGMTTSVWCSQEIKMPVKKVADELRIALGDPKKPGFSKLFRQWERLDGYPVQTVTTVPTAQGPLITSETLISYKELKINPSMFSVPKDYTKVVDPITQMEQMQKRMREQAAGIQRPLNYGKKRK
ncbi:MAG: hypothetical protein GY822_08495 [Deltaproteobacteria bacterium]|nr:hypothetical protein [Deltaproteobacteria bacterium]